MTSKTFTGYKGIAALIRIDDWEDGRSAVIMADTLDDLELIFDRCYNDPAFKLDPTKTKPAMILASTTLPE